jgi:hypothetical protein
VSSIVADSVHLTAHNVAVNAHRERLAAQIFATKITVNILNFQQEWHSVMDF